LAPADGNYYRESYEFSHFEVKALSGVKIAETICRQKILNMFLPFGSVRPVFVYDVAEYALLRGKPRGEPVFLRHGSVGGGIRRNSLSFKNKVYFFQSRPYPCGAAVWSAVINRLFYFLRRNAGVKT